MSIVFGCGDVFFHADAEGVGDEVDAAINTDGIVVWEKVLSKFLFILMQYCNAGDAANGCWCAQWAKLGEIIWVFLQGDEVGDSEDFLDG